MSRLLCLSCFTLITLHSSSILQAQSETKPQTGPIKSGLSLQLITQYGGKADSKNQILIRLINKSGKEMTLKSHQDAKSYSKYKDYLKACIEFSSYPKIEPSSFSYDFGGHDCSANISLKPGQAIDVRISDSDRTLYGGALRQSFLHFERDGTYFIRALATIHNADGKFIKLWSNEARYIVGNSKEQPHPSMGKVTKVKSKEGKPAVEINLGKNLGVQEGDVFHSYPPRGHHSGSHWKLTITEVQEHSAWARIEPYRAKGIPRSKKPPLVGDIVSLMRAAKKTK